MLGVTFGTDTACLHNKEILSTFFVPLKIFLQCHHPVVSEQVKDRSTQCFGEINVSYKHVTVAPDSAQSLRLKGLEISMVFLISRFHTLPVSVSFQFVISVRIFKIEFFLNSHDEVFWVVAMVFLCGLF